MARNASHFARGSGAYRCGVCNHLTRSTGRGDNENAGLCADCYDLAGEDNHLTDNGELYSSKAEVLRMIEAVRTKTGNDSLWAELKAEAEGA